MLKTYEGSVRKGRFYPKGAKVIIPDSQKVILTILDEAIQDAPSDQLSGSIIETNVGDDKTTYLDDTTKQRKSWLEKLSLAIAQSMDEDLPDMHRGTKMLAPVCLSD